MCNLIFILIGIILSKNIINFVYVINQKLKKVKKMKRKKCKFEAAAILIGIIIISSTFVQAAQQSNVDITKDNEIEENNLKENPQSSECKRYFIFGRGIGSRIGIYGTWGGGKIEGDVKITFDDIRSPPFLKSLFTFLFVLDLETNKIYSLRGKLPDPIFITSFKGAGHGFNNGHGMCGFFYCVYYLRGFASEVNLDNN